jgi:hypothetical protein
MNNLLSQELLKRFKEIGSQDEPNPLVIAKFFTPWSTWTWYAFSYSEETGAFFGLIDGSHKELGYFAIEDLRGLRGPTGLRVERDLYWREKRLSDIKRKRPPTEPSL